ncbi:nuclear GTP-binding protein nug1 [Friedmanniomyces endolithicus]|uniref:Nuclear GTP-binding protein nug1 n=3 Tax=Dothideomycetidae TaxID=451867 RepID=A0AAN6JVQ5_9PEZI|nr:nuclear GTP-binding protein nug1 [Friedmanniomyces endolithicus]
MRIGKPVSKRTPVRLRHKIQKASVAKQRKGRKEAKKNPQWRSRLTKDPGIPNLFPYKAKVLAEIEEGRRKKTEEAQRRKDVAKAQRQGTAVSAEVAGAGPEEAEEDDDEVLLDEEDADVDDDDEEMEEQGGSNPMAALLASAQARAQAYTKEDVAGDDDDESESEGADEWNGIDEVKSTAPAGSTRKTLPKQALADPIKAVSALLERMKKTQDGIQRLLDHYQIPPIATASSDATSRFLVEVARKRGRLGRGGVPNLNTAALMVLSDVNEERLRLPAEMTKKPGAAVNKGDVQIVSQIAQPFRIEGLFGGEPPKSGGETSVAMEVESPLASVQIHGLNAATPFRKLFAYGDLLINLLHGFTVHHIPYPALSYQTRSECSAFGSFFWQHADHEGNRGARYDAHGITLAGFGWSKPKGAITQEDESAVHAHPYSVLL